MQVQYVLVETMLFPGIIGNALCGHLLGIHRPALLMPSLALALLSLAVLAVFAIAMPTGLWFWVVVIYSVTYLLCLLMFGWKWRQAMSTQQTG
jgi:membrane protein implicated in regulation of membrane protease activity